MQVYFFHEFVSTIISLLLYALLISSIFPSIQLAVISKKEITGTSFRTFTFFVS